MEQAHKHSLADDNLSADQVGQKTSWLWPLMVFVVGSVVLTVVVWAKPTPKPRVITQTDALIQVPVVALATAEHRFMVEGQGTVRPKREINLVAEVSGSIQRVQSNYVPGGLFDKGDLLLAIDDRDFQAAKLSAEARLADAQRRLAEEEGLALQAKREWRDLGSQQANDLFVRKPQLAAAKANLASVKADYEKALLDIARTQITAPFKGRVRTVSADLGQFVARGTVLATVYDDTVMVIRLPLTERQAALVDIPLAANNIPHENLTQVRANIAGTDGVWQGKLTRADAYVDAESRMYFVFIEIPMDQQAKHLPPLLPGIFAEVEVAGKVLPNVIKLPRSALFQRDQLWVVDEQNIAKSLRADVLQKNNQHIWLDGQKLLAQLIQNNSLQNTVNWRAITAKQSLLKDGDKVDVIVDDPSQDQAQEPSPPTNNATQEVSQKIAEP